MESKSCETVGHSFVIIKQTKTHIQVLCMKCGDTKTVIKGCETHCREGAKMTDQEVSKIITEKMGGCWHEWKADTQYHDDYLCLKCGIKKQSHQLYPPLLGGIDWTSRERFLDLWDWVLSQLWGYDFFLWLWDKHYSIRVGETIDRRYIAQPAFARLVAEWLKEE